MVGSYAKCQFAGNFGVGNNLYTIFIKCQSNAKGMHFLEKIEIVDLLRTPSCTTCTVI